MFESFGFDDGIDVMVFAIPERIEHLLGCIVGNGAVCDTANQDGQLALADGGCFNRLFVHIQPAR